ncbi:MAG: hypothetical protein ACO1OB_16980 [Archangium sp.]
MISRSARWTTTSRTAVTNARTRRGGAMTAGEEFVARHLGDGQEEEVADVEELPLDELKSQAEMNVHDERADSEFEAEKIEATEEPPMENGEPQPLKMDL